MRVRHLWAMIGLFCALATGSVLGQGMDVVPPLATDGTYLPGNDPYVPCGDSCDTMANRGWFADGGVYVLQPRWQTNQALATSTPLGGGRNSFSAVDFQYGFNTSPYINLGYVADSGLGFRLGYWDFSASAVAGFTPAPGGVISSAAPLGLTAFANPNRMQANTRLQFQVFDAELTQQLEGYGWLWTASGGVRYLHMNQTYDVTTFGTAAAVDDLTSNHSLNAAGPTLALRGRRQLGDSCFSLYGGARGSLVFGDNTQQSHLFSASGVQGDQAFQSSRSYAAISELDLGVWYQRRYAPVTVVATAALVGQYWSNVGNAANTDTFTAFANDESQNNNLGMGLFGAQASLQFWF